MDAGYERAEVVEVIRCLRKNASVILIVKVPGGVQIAVPEWMLIPQTCDQLKTEDKSRISVGALMDLRRLIDAQCTGPRFIAEIVPGLCSRIGGWTHEH